MLVNRLQIKIDILSKQPIYVQLANQIIELIEAGVLQRGQRLPSSRLLGNSLNLHRNTILKSFEELALQGWIYSEPGRGTYVNNELPILIRKNNIDQPKNANNKEKQLAIKSRKEFLKIDDGYPDQRMHQITEFAREHSKIVKSGDKMHLLSKDKSLLGSINLRKSLCKYLGESRGLNFTEDEIMITNGSQMGIYLCADMYLKPQDYFVVGSTNYRSANQTFLNFSNRILYAQVDTMGMSIEQLREICKNKNVKLVYVTPHHHYPTTVTMSVKRRLEFLQLAEEVGFIVLEDDYDYDFHYTHQPIMPMTSSGKPNFIYLGSFSKLLSPLFRIGFIVGDNKLLNQLAQKRKLLDGGGNLVVEESIAKMINMGELDRIKRKSLKLYKEKREFFAEQMQDKLSSFVDFKVPEGGLAFWLTLKDIKANELYDVLLKKGIKLLNPSDFQSDVSRPNGLRIGFASLNKEEMILLINEIQKSCQIILDSK